MARALLLACQKRNSHSKQMGADLSAPISDCQTSLAEFAAEAANKVAIVFGRGVYVDKNTAQAASVELVRHKRTNYARSRLQNTVGKAFLAFPTSGNGSGFCTAPVKTDNRQTAP